MPYGSDCNFTNELMLTRINADLANDLGNLVSRTVAMADKYFGGTLPTDRVSDELDNQLIGMAQSLCDTVTPLIEQAQHSKALEEIFKVISRANKYIDETAPWVLAKDERIMPVLRPYSITCLKLFVSALHCSAPLCPQQCLRYGSK